MMRGTRVPAEIGPHAAEARAVTSPCPAPPDGGPPLRVAVVLDDLDPPRWVRQLIAALENPPDSSLALIVVPGAPAESNGPERANALGLSHGALPHVGELAVRSSGLLFRLYGILDRAIFSVRPDPLERAGEPPLNPRCPILRLPAAGATVGRVPPEPLSAALRDQSADVVLDLGSRALPGAAGALAAHGMWAYRHGGVRERSHGPAGVREVLSGAPVTITDLVAHGGADHQPHVLARAAMRTQKFSPYRNERLCVRKAAALVPRALRTLHEMGPAGLPDFPPDPPPPPGEAGTGAEPTNGEMLRGLGLMARTLAGRVVHRARWPGGWFVAYSLAGAERPGGAPAMPEETWTRLVPPRDRFWADPIPVQANGRHWIFVEEYLYRTRRGHIAVFEVADDGRCAGPVPVLERPHHLSYPFVFQWRGEHFMVPESLAGGSVELYRATGFPFAWERCATLLQDVRAVDATLLEHQGRWWMFTNMAQEPAMGPEDWNEELHVFHADTPLGPWTPHRRNPVTFDIRGSRPAGPLYQAGGALYRPAQDCSERYGHAMTINLVTRLSPTEFHEEVAGRIAPEWTPHLIGTHTIGAAGALSVVDGRYGWLRSRAASRGSAAMLGDASESQRKI